ncbi:MAG: hypothetical protein R3C56_12370 [Pirellulaceae bacterium]
MITPKSALVIGKVGPNNMSDDPALAQVPQFSHFYLRQMSAEQLYHSLVQVGGQSKGTLEQQQAERDIPGLSSLSSRLEPTKGTKPPPQWLDPRR